MKKSVISIFSVVLIVAMIFSMSASAFAQGTEEAQYQKFDKMVCFADSIGQAWGYEDVYFPNMVADKTGVGKAYAPQAGNYGYIDTDVLRSKDTMVYLNADELAQTDRVFFESTGLRATEILIALGGAQKDNSDPYYGATSAPSSKVADMAAANSAYYIEAVKQSDLIVLEVGSDDVLYYAQELSGLMDVFGNIGDISTDELTAFLANYSKLLYTGFDNFCRDFPKVVERIQEIKGDAEYKLVVVGVYNPVNGIKINDSIATPIGDLATTVTALQNAKYREWEKKYGFEFADITNVPTQSMTDDVTLTAFSSGSAACYATHPKHTVGYEYIANQILDLLPEEEAKPDNNIRINLGAVKSVSSVSVGSNVINSKSYTFDPVTKKLTINYLLPTATTCTVTSVDENGRIYVATYQLSYSSEKGYTPYLIYSTNDAVKTSTTVLNNVGSVTKTVGSALKSLFSK